MISAFLIKWWDEISLGFLFLNLIYQKIQTLDGSSDFLTYIGRFIGWILSFVRKAVVWIFTAKTTPGKLPMIFIGLFLLIPSLVFAGAEVTFEWDSNTEPDMSHYNIYRSDDNQATWNKVNPAPIAHTGMGTETWTDTNVPDGNYYWYNTAVNTSSKESEESNIVSKSLDTTDPIVFIISPLNNSIYHEGISISFSGSADDQGVTGDGILTGDSLVWTSSIDGQIGTGVMFAKNNLSIGTHTITLSATDSSDNTGNEAISLTIEESTAPAPPQNLIIVLIKKIIAWIMNLFKPFRCA